MDGNKNRSGGGVHLQLLSDRPVRDYEMFLVNMMRVLDGRQVRSLALVAELVEPEENGADMITAYHKMPLRDRQMAVAAIEEDITYEIARRAILDIAAADEEDEEDA